MQVYRVSDMELVRVLPSAEEEVNVAVFILQLEEVLFMELR